MRGVDEACDQNVGTYIAEANVINNKADVFIWGFLNTFE